MLVCRYRPRGIRRGEEGWDEWCKELGPSPQLHAAAYGKGQAPIGWGEYRRRYLSEIADPPASFFVEALRARIAAGEDVALLCSSACEDEAACHRSLLAALVRGAR